MSNLKEIAKKCNVSVRTVTRALYGHGEISPETAQKIKDAASALNYIPNYAARSLRLKKTFTIGLIRYSFDIDIQNKRIQVITEEMDKRGYNILQGIYHDEQKAVELISNFRQRCDGLILYLHKQFLPEPFFKPLLEQNCPFVIVDAEMAEARKYPCVCIDREAGIVQAIQYLAEIGKKDIAFLMMSLDSLPRINGFKKGLKKINVPFSQPRFIIMDHDDTGLRGENPIQTYPAESFMQAGYVAGLNHKAIGRDFNALLCFDDKVALGVLRALSERGIKVPQEVAVIGIDDDSFAAFTHVPLSTIRQPIHRVAYAVVESIINQIEGREAVSKTFPAEFIRRKTT
jgi:LacI family transcriptional regulator